ncbi:MAG: acyltransferase [Flavobacterium sp.]|nr:acyltransferase [Flavobacterium sp.]
MLPEKKAQYLDVLQILRGIAALMVVMHHSVGSIKFYHRINYHWLDFIGGMGKFGVDFFFVLSGFIISYSAYFKHQDPSAFSKYVKARLIRIYVPYLPIGIFMLLLYSYFPGFSNGGRIISTFTSLTLLPGGNPALSVAWTLTFELCFYFLFSLYFFSKKGWNYFIVFWLVTIVFVNYSGVIAMTSVTNLYLKIFFSTYNIEFILGYFLSLVILKKMKFNFIVGAFLLLILTIPLLYGKYFEIEWFSFSLNLLFASIVFIIVYLAIIFFNYDIKKTSVFMMIGNATYSIYLIHNPLQMILIRFLPRINAVYEIALTLLLTLIISSFFGYIYYFVFEKKVMKVLMNKFAK